MKGVVASFDAPNIRAVREFAAANFLGSIFYAPDNPGARK